MTENLETAIYDGLNWLRSVIGRGAQFEASGRRLGRYNTAQAAAQAISYERHRECNPGDGA